MKDLLNNVTATLYALNGVTVSGENNIDRMQAAFRLLHGMETYLKNLPEEEADGGE